MVVVDNVWVLDMVAIGIVVVVRCDCVLVLWWLVVGGA